MLFDKHEKPVLTGLDEESDWAACEEWEDYVYNTAESYSDDQWDKMIDSICALYDEYYRLYEG